MRQKIVLFFFFEKKKKALNAPCVAGTKITELRHLVESIHPHRQPIASSSSWAIVVLLQTILIFKRIHRRRLNKRPHQTNHSQITTKRSESNDYRPLLLLLLKQKVIFSAPNCLFLFFLAKFNSSTPRLLFVERSRASVWLEAAAVNHRWSRRATSGSRSRRRLQRRSWDAAAPLIRLLSGV